MDLNNVMWHLVQYEGCKSFWVKNGIEIHKQSSHSSEVDGISNYSLTLFKSIPQKLSSKAIVYIHEQIGYVP